jgi:prepilin-type N-terminal cleavage/methylation domain-containing protein
MRPVHTRPRAWPHNPLPHAAGFTLVELVMVLVLIATLAAVALPRMVDTTVWSLRSYSDTLLSQLQAARRLALAQRRPIVATIAPTGVSLDYAAGGNLALLSCPPAVANCITETGSASFNAGNSGSATTSSGGVLRITVSGGGSFSRQLQIAPETGLIQAPS